MKLFSQPSDCQPRAPGACRGLSWVLSLPRHGTEPAFVTMFAPGTSVTAGSSASASEHLPFQKKPGLCRHGGLRVCVVAQVISLAHTPFPLSYCSQTPDFKAGVEAGNRARRGGKYL